MAETKVESFSKLSEVMRDRILKRIRAVDAGGKNMGQALTRVGLLLESQIKLNIQKKRIVDRGGLLNSIRFELNQAGNAADLRVGSFGIPYAAIHEFGGQFTNDMRRAMFAKLRDQGRIQQNRNKNVVQNGRIIPRPYLRPALTKHRARIMQILRDQFGNRT